MGFQQRRLGGDNVCDDAAFQAGQCVVKSQHPSLFRMRDEQQGFDPLRVASCFCVIILLSILIEHVTEKLEHSAHRQGRTYVQIGAKVLKELMILGLISFSMFIASEVVHLNETSLYLPLEFAHIVIFFTAIWYVADARLYLWFAERICRRFDAALAAKKSLLQTRLAREWPGGDNGGGNTPGAADGAAGGATEGGRSRDERFNAGNCIQRCNRWLRWRMSFTYNAAVMHILRAKFVAEHRLPATFDFGHYLHLSLNDNISELLDVAPSTWAILMVIVWIVYFICLAAGLGKNALIVGFIIVCWLLLAMLCAIGYVGEVAISRATRLCMGVGFGAPAFIYCTPHRVVHHALSLMPEDMTDETIDAEQRRVREFIATHNALSGDLRDATEQAHNVHRMGRHSSRKQRVQSIVQGWDGLSEVFVLRPAVLHKLLELAFLLMCMIKSVFVCYFMMSDGTSVGDFFAIILPIALSMFPVWPIVAETIYFIDAIAMLEDHVLGATLEDMQEARELKVYLLHRLHAHSHADPDWLRTCFDEWSKFKDDDGMIDRAEMKMALRMLDINLSHFTFNKLMRLLDLDRNGKIAYDEFAQFVCSLTPEEYLAASLNVLDLHESQHHRLQRRVHRSLRAFNRGCAESEDAEFNADEDTYVPGFVELKRFAGERGRGLVALRNVRAGKFLLRAPCLRVSRAQYQSHLKFTELEHYVFSLRTGDVLVAFGWGSMFNHNKRPNVNFKVVSPPRGSAVDDCHIDFTASSDVKAGEELCICYGHRPDWDSADEDDEDGTDSGGEREGLAALMRVTNHSDSDSDVGADENDCAGDDGANTDTVGQQPISLELVEQSLESTRSSEQ